MPSRREDRILGNAMTPEYLTIALDAYLHPESQFFLGAEHYARILIDPTAGGLLYLPALKRAGVRIHTFLIAEIDRATQVVARWNIRRLFPMARVIFAEDVTLDGRFSDENIRRVLDTATTAPILINGWPCCGSAGSNRYRDVPQCSGLENPKSWALAHTARVLDVCVRWLAAH